MIDWQSFFFLLFASVSCLAAVAVVLTGDVVRMAVYLILSLSGAAGLFFLAGAEFVGAMQLMVYVGGTLVLLIFGVMLTARQSLVKVQPHTNEWVLAMVVGLVMLMTTLLPVMLAVGDWGPAAVTESHGGEPVALEHVASPERMGGALLGLRTDADRREVASERHEGLVGYLLPFEMISVYLLVVLIGAAYLARPKRRTAIAAEVRQ